MGINRFFNKGISIRRQQPGWPADGPISLCLKTLSGNFQEGSPDHSSGLGNRAISPVGADLARIYAKRKLWVLFVNTEGSGVAPWRGLIILDPDLRGEGQIKSPGTMGMIAHELTHLLQRDINQPHYWPSGGLRPAFGRRWIGDSTNYMEVLSYLVGWTVEYDFMVARTLSPGQSTGQHARDERALATIRDRLATLTGADARNACRLMLKLFPTNAVYRKNFQLESRIPDGRIPPGSWHTWLRQMGFSRQAVDHIMILSARGHAERIEVDQIA
jgi:hypothetical protein